MRILYLIILLLLPFQILAQDIHFFWNKFIGSDDGSCWAEITTSIATSDNGVLFAGVTNCNDNGDIPPFQYPNMNVFIGKMDSNENVSWIKMFGGSSSTDGIDALFEFSNGTYGVGLNSASTEFSGQHGGGDIILLRLDTGGNVLSQKCYGGPYFEQAMSICETAEGGFLVFGCSSGSGDDVPNHYGQLMFSNDWWVFKTDSAGNIIWSKVFGGTDDENLRNSTVMSFNNQYYLFSASKSKDVDCNDLSWHSTQVETDRDLYLLKLDTAGNLLWSKSYGGSAFEESGAALFDIRDSTIVMVGESQSNDYLATGNHGSSDAYILKVDLNGDIIWKNMVGTTAKDIPTSIITYTNNGYLLFGNITFGTVGLVDGWISVIDSDSVATCRKEFGSLDNDFVRSIIHHKNSYIVTGSAGEPAFIEGANIGHQGVGPAAFSFISYFDVWPLSVLKNEVIKEELFIYPNPTTNELHIKCALPIFSFVSITDGLGREVIREILTGKETTLDIKHLVPAVYFITLEGAQGRETRRFVKY